MAERGGYQRPRNPAPVSGPGSLSRRTDGGPADPKAMQLRGGGEYGESKELGEIQSAAPMREPAMPPITPLDAPSTRPDEPVTFGADEGAGPGTAALGIPSEERGDLEAMLPYLKMLEWFANQPNASASTRAFIRRIKAAI